MLEKFVRLNEPMPAVDSKERVVIRAHRDWLLNHPDTQSHAIDTRHSVPDKYNWYRYLATTGWPEYTYYAIFIMNDITDPMSLDERYQTILLPSVAAVQQIRMSIV